MQYVRKQLERDTLAQITDTYDCTGHETLIQEELRELCQEFRLSFRDINITKKTKQREITEYTCKARIWNGGHPCQCSHKQRDGTEYCKKHKTSFLGDGWWLGRIDEPRPVNPVYIDKHGKPNPKTYLD
jgi:hypothetical protein